MNPRFRSSHPLGLACVAVALTVLFAESSSAASGPAGGGQPVPTEQPTIELRYLICTEGLYAAPDSGGSPAGESLPMIGEIQVFAGTFTPAGWHECDGALLSVTEHDPLFDLIGTTYGGDGISTFAVPDLRGRIPIGYDAAHPLGSVTGSTSVTLTESQLGPHTHPLPGGQTGPAGGGAPVDFTQPSLALNYMIATEGQFDYMGDVRIFAFGHELNRWKRCDGRLLSINLNQALFSWLGTSYGGDGQTRFALPDLRGRTVIGTGTGTGGISRVIAASSGQSTVTLTGTQLPPHTHSLLAGTTGGSGLAEPIDQMQPSVAMNIFITDVGIYPTVNGAENYFVGSLQFRAVGNRLNSRIPADGAQLFRSTSDPLRSIIGNTFGGGGVTFYPPDTRGRAIKGAVSGGMGTLAGSETLILTTAQMPSHTHDSGPGAQTYAATSVMAREATLWAWVAPHGLATAADFQHGLTESYGGVLPITLNNPAGASGQWISMRLKNLTPLTSYHFRVVASNAEGTTAGQDFSFTTRAEVPRNFEIDTGGIHFGALIAGRQSGPQRVTVINSGDFPLALTSMTLTGGNLPDDFSVMHDPLPPSLAPGDSFSVFLRFTPQHTGDRNTVLRWVSDDPDQSTVDVMLYGTAGNNSPAVINGGLPDQQMLPSSSTPLRFDLRSVFIDPDGHPLTFFLINQTNPGVSTGTLNGNILTINSLSTGNSTVQLRAKDPYEAAVDFTFNVQVHSNPVPPQSAGFQELTRATLFPDGQWLEWAGTPGHKYRVEWSTDLGSWQTAVTDILAGAARVTWKDSTAGERRFYRIAADVGSGQ